MHIRTPRRGRRLVASAATLGLLGLPLLTSTADAAPTAAGKTKAPAVKVMTRNVYLGADIMRPLGAMAAAKAAGGTDMDVLNAFANANDVTQDISVQTDFPARAELLAAELVEHRPDLVGLQEVALWRQAEGETMDLPGSPGFLIPNATDETYDYLQILLDELKAQGVVYKAISVNTLSDVEGPAWEGNLGLHTNARDVRLTMRDVILKRKDSPVSVVRGSATKAVYATNMPPIVVSNKSIEFKRGYQSVDVLAGDRKFRFINTHLEAFSSDVAYAQAQELISGPGAYKGRTIIVCDCNSDPANGTVKPNDSKRHWAPYFLMKREGGFNDTWLQWAPPEEGFTSGLTETVDDETAAKFDHRIDMVFARTAKGDKLPVLSGEVTGDEVADRNAAGLWPSDHAGVVMKLRLR